MTRQQLLEKRYTEMQEELRRELDAAKAARRFAELMAAAIEEAITASTVEVNGTTYPVE